MDMRCGLSRIPFLDLLCLLIYMSDQRGEEWLVGIDEAGRGPLAGPVHVGFVRIATGVDIVEMFPGLNDSKKLSEKKREEIFSHLEVGLPSADIVWHVESASESMERRIAGPRGWVDGR